MAEIEPDVAPASGFKVRPLSRVVKAESSLAETEKAEGHKQKADSESSKPPNQTKPSRLRELTEELRSIEARIRLGGGPDKILKQHKARKLTARERIDLLLDQDTYRQEIGLLVAYDQYLEGRGQRAEVRSQRAEVSRRHNAELKSQMKSALRQPPGW